MNVNPEKLALLSDGELGLLADRMGLNLPDDLDRQFVLEEIIDAIDEEHQEHRFAHDAPGHVEEKKFSGIFQGSTDPVSDLSYARYNETAIKALARDPSWIFAYWDLSDSRRATLGLDEGTAGLFLRVTESAEREDSHRDFFDIPVSMDDFRWYINVPHPGSRYRIDLCVHLSPRIKVLAKSEPVSLPLLYLRERRKDMDRATRSLLILSGCDDLNLAQPENRNPSRILQDGE